MNSVIYDLLCLVSSSRITDGSMYMCLRLPGNKPLNSIESNNLHSSNCNHPTIVECLIRAQLRKLSGLLTVSHHLQYSSLLQHLCLLLYVYSIASSLEHLKELTKEERHRRLCRSLSPA